jgi:copper chaperone CopZ
MSQTHTYTVSGMTCDHCARAVRAEVGAVDGVSGVDVDVASGTLRVTSTHPVAFAQLREAVSEAGYTLLG